MNRRNFISSLSAAVAGAVLDEDRLLWVPGRKVFSIPAAKLYDPTLVLPHMSSLSAALARKFNQRKWDRLMRDLEFSKRGLPFPKMPEYRLPFHLVRGTGSAKDYMNPDL